MEKKNERIFKKAEKAKRNQFALEYELYSVVTGTKTYVFLIERIMQRLKPERLRFPMYRNSYKNAIPEMSKIVELGILKSLRGNIFRS